MIDDFLLNLAAGLTQTLLEAGTNRLRQAALGTDEERALKAALERAFAALLAEAADGLPRDDLAAEHEALLRAIFADFLRRPDVANNLLALALAGTPPDLPLLSQRFDALDYDRQTLAVDFDALLLAYHRGLTQALLQEAGQAGSALFSRVSLGRTLSIEALLQDQQSTLARVSRAIARLEQSDARTVYNIVIEQATGVAIGDGATVEQPRLSMEIQALLSQILKRIEDLFPSPSSDFNSSDIYNACRDITNRSVSDMFAHVAPHPIIIRQPVNERLEVFLGSSMRYAVILGPSSVGKSVTLARHAQMCVRDGWATILLNARSFSLDYLAEQIVNDGLGYEHTPPWRQVMVTPWMRTRPAHLKGFLLMLDAIDEGDLESIEQELTRLHNGIGHIDSRHFKIIISCRDVVWDQKLTQTGLFADSSSLQVIEVADFTAQELNDALNSIGAAELLEARLPGEPPDPHLETLRDLLKHPGTFGLYAQTRASAGVASISELTWSQLIERYLSILQQVGRRCGKMPDFLREQLISFVEIAREQEARDFRLSKGTLRNELKELEVDTADPRLSPYYALLEHNFFFESTGPGASGFVGFANSDVGSFLLSIVLEREAEQQSLERLEELISDWLTEVHRFTPVLDAILAWLDRLTTTNPRNDVLLILLKKVTETHVIRPEIAFRLVHPAIVDALLNAVDREETPYLYAYREAVRAVRFSPEALTIARRRIFSHNVQVQELAITYLGAHCDAESTYQLIDLLEGSDDPDGEDRGVQEAAYAALRKIGLPALHSLLQVINDQSASSHRRSRCLGAVRAIGRRDEEVSIILSGCLKNAKSEEDPELIKSALLAAAHLRDETQTQHAISALSNPDWQVVQYAAKFLAEVPDVNAVSTLQQTVQRACAVTGTEERRMWRDFALRQCMAALVKIGTEESMNTVVQTLSRSLQGQTTLPPVWATWAAGDLAVPAASSLLLKFWIQTLREKPESGLVWHALERLKRVWHPEHLSLLATTAAHLVADGTDIAHIVVDSILESDVCDANHPLKDHNARVSSVNVLAKCQTANFALDVGRLISEAEWSFDLTLYDALWILGSTDAEIALLQQLERLPSESKTDNTRRWFQRSRLLRSLGTCGHQQGANIVLEHLRSSTEIALYFSEESICPLVQRGLLSTEDLIEVISNNGTSAEGRTAILIALGTVDASAHKDLFLENVKEAENHTLQGYAARLLRFTSDKSTAPDLRRVLRITSDPFVAEQSAETLAWFGDQEAVSLIEGKLIDFAETDHAEGLVAALEKYRQPSSLPILLELLETTRSMVVEYRLIEALGAFLSDERAKQIVVNWLETWHGIGADAGRQPPAIRALARYDPGYLLDRSLTLYDSGRLYKGAREQLARWVPYLTRQEECRGRMAVELTKRLVCDRELTVREFAGQSLSHMENALTQTVYTELSTSSDEWLNACAVYSLGFMQGNVDDIRSHRYAPSFKIRYFADRALETFQMRSALKQLVEIYRGGSGIERLSAYLAIAEHGDEQTIATLRETVSEEHFNHIFLRQLSSNIRERVRKERRDRAKEEQDALGSSGTVSFD